MKKVGKILTILVGILTMIFGVCYIIGRKEEREEEKELNNDDWDMLNLWFINYENFPEAKNVDELYMQTKKVVNELNVEIRRISIITESRILERLNFSGTRQILAYGMYDTFSDLHLELSLVGDGSLCCKLLRRKP